MESQTSTGNQALDATEISERLGIPLPTIRRWLAQRRDIFPNARKERPMTTSKWVTDESDVLAYEQKYLKRNN